MMHATRRQFLHGSLAAAAGLALAPAAPAIEPITRTGGPQMRLSLAAYSFRKYLDLKRKPRPEMTLDDFIDLGARLKLPAVELTAYYFPHTTPEYLDHLKEHCRQRGLVVSGTAVGNDFCLLDPARRQEQIDMVKRWSEHTARLGGKTMRIFAGRVARGDSEAKARARCVEAIEEACAHAGKQGVYLALENHGGITGTAEQTLAIVKAVRSPWFGVNLDTGNFHTADPYADLARLAPYAVTVQLKTEIHPAGKKTEEADLGRLIDILRGVRYQGFVALEYEAAEDPKTGVPRAIEKLKKLVRA